MTVFANISRGDISTSAPGVQLQPPALSARRTIVSRPVPTVRCARCNLFEVERWLLVGGVGIAVAQPGALSSIQRRASRDRRREGAEPCVSSDRRMNKRAGGVQQQMGGLDGRGEDAICWGRLGSSTGGFP